MGSSEVLVNSLNVSKKMSLSLSSFFATENKPLYLDICNICKEKHAFKFLKSNDKLLQSALIRSSSLDTLSSHRVSIIRLNNWPGMKPTNIACDTHRMAQILCRLCKNPRKVIAKMLSQTSDYVSITTQDDDIDEDIGNKCNSYDFMSNALDNYNGLHEEVACSIGSDNFGRNQQRNDAILNAIHDFTFSENNDLENDHQSTDSQIFDDVMRDSSELELLAGKEPDSTNRDFLNYVNFLTMNLPAANPTEKYCDDTFAIDPVLSLDSAYVRLKSINRRLTNEVISESSDNLSLVLNDNPSVKLSSASSCPSLTPSVVISDHSNSQYGNTIRNAELSTGKLHICNHIIDLKSSIPIDCQRRYSSNSLCSSASSLSTLGVEDGEDNPLDYLDSSLSFKKASPWKKVRNVVHWSPFIQTYKKHKYPWVQLAGHQGNFRPGNPGTILKKSCGEEESCFQKLLNDVIYPFIPKYIKNVNDHGEEFLELQDLLANFESPCVMDIKMGVRTYLEGELAKAREKPKLRKDMFEKMVQINPDEPNEEEMALGAITKPRYMIWRETISSTATLGFRVEGIKYSDGLTSKDFKTTKAEEQIEIAFKAFIDNNQTSVNKYIERLKDIRHALDTSTFFKTHELIGSSLLFVHDSKDANIWMIDFAKTYPVPQGIVINHIDEWKIGNHEDGYLIGLESLIRIFEKMKHD